MKRLLTLCLMLLAAAAPQAPRAGRAGSEPLRLVFPQEGDTLSFPHVRFAGSTGVNVDLRVQGRKIRVYPSGAFAGLVNLKPGWNSIVFIARSEAGIALDTLHVFRETAPPDYPAAPTAVAPASIEPGSDVFLKAGLEFGVEFRGSPGGRASGRIGGLARFPLRELPRRKTGGRRGIYRGKIALPEDFNPSGPLTIEFLFTGRDGHTFRFQAPGKLSVIPANSPMIAVTTDSANFFRRKAGGETEFELPAGIRLEVVERRRKMSRVRLARGQDFFIDSRGLKVLPKGAAFPFTTVGDMIATDAPGKLVIRIRTSHPAPFRIEQSERKRRINVFFYRTVRAKQWVYYPASDATIRRVSSRQYHGDALKITFHLNQKQQWGYGGEYKDGEFRLTIRKKPLLSAGAGKPLAGLTVAVDAGHGGSFEGVIGATGLREERVNLDLARRVRDLLEARGARVIMTRNSDSTLTLQSRVALARREGAHAFLSLHNNAVGADIDPLKRRGASVFYTLPQSRRLANRIYERLTHLGLRPGGSKVESYVVTRQTDLLSCLVEGAFLTHPEDEMLLLDMGFRQRLAQAVAAGLEDFIVAQIPPERGGLRSSERPSR